MAAPIVPQFTQGQLNSRVESSTVIQESITSYNYRTGYSYSAAGHNVETVGDVPISPDATRHQQSDRRWRELFLD